MGWNACKFLVMFNIHYNVGSRNTCLVRCPRSYDVPLLFFFFVVVVGRSCGDWGTWERMHNCCFRPFKSCV